MCSNVLTLDTTLDTTLLSALNEDSDEQLDATRPEQE
jgi:hypothetical protein